MKRCAHFLLLTGFLCLIFSKNSFSQAATPDSSSQQSALNNTLALFYSSIGKQSPLYNGTEYYPYDPLIKGNAYFQDVNAFTPGSVYYDDVMFKGVPMLYDIYGDQVAALLYNHFTGYYLIKDKVASFDYLGHHFINIDTVTSLNNPVIKPGYYDELYNGKVQILVKRSKNIQTTTGLQTAESYFNESKEYFIKKNNLYYSFSSKGSLLGILKDKKKDLQRYIKSSEINFHREPEEAMVKIASYYDHLTN